MKKNIYSPKALKLTNESVMQSVILQSYYYHGLYQAIST